MNKEKVLDRLRVLRAFVKQSESDMKLAKISYRRYQQDLAEVWRLLDEIEEDVKSVRGKTIFDKWFGNPMEAIEDNFDADVHKAIEECYEHSTNNL